MSRRPNWPPKDFAHFCIHGLCGLVMGAVLGLGAYTQSSARYATDFTPLFLYMGIGALIFGILAGFYGDELWKSIKSWWW
jgi:hypothetical protein